MAAISLFWYTNMAAVTSDENDLLKIGRAIINAWRILMIYMWFTGKNYDNLAVEKDRDSILNTTVTTEWKPGLTKPV